MNSHLAIAALAASCIVASVPASAEDRVITVRHADLDLANSRDVRRLDRRIMHAATEVCGTASTSDLVAVNDTEGCIDASIEAARRQRDQIVIQSRRQARR